MANPQPTDAHLRMAHSINEAMMMRDFTKRQRKILDLILRLSWGCGQKDAYIPLQRDFSVVGVHEVDVKAELNWLEISKVIGRQEQFYWFNKDFEEWEVSRVKPYQPIRLSDLLSLNLNGNRPKLSETLSPDLVKHLVPTKYNTKFATPNLATPKERGEGREGGGEVPLSPRPPIKESIKEINTDNNTENKDILISGQSIEKVKRILRGEIEGIPENRKKYLKSELEKLGEKI